MTVTQRTDATLGCPLDAPGARPSRTSPPCRHPSPVAAEPLPSLRLVTSGALGVILFTAHRRFDALLDAIAACGEGNDLTWIE